MENNNLIFGGYFRKSSDNEDRQVLSIDSQMNEIKELARKEGLSISESISESKSAKAPGRPGFNRFIEKIEKGEINAIFCWKLDRLARNFVDGGKIIDLLQRGIIKQIRTHERIYLPSDNVLMMAMEFGMANQFIRDLSANVKRGLREKAYEKGYPTGMAKIGYMNDKTEEKGNRKWIKDPIRFPLVQQLFEMYLSGRYSVPELHRIARDKMKLTTPQRKKEGGKPVAVSYIYTMLADPIYAGFDFYEGKRFELNIKLERVITEDEHIKIQNMLGQKGRPRMRSEKQEGLYNYFMKDQNGGSVTPDFKYQLICNCKHKFAYRAKEVCPKCGKFIQDIERPIYLEYIYYTSSKEKKDRTIKAKSIEEKQIDKLVFNYISENVDISQELCDWCIKHIGELKDKEIEDTKAILQSQAESEVVIKRKLNNLLDLRLSRENLTNDEIHFFDEKERTLKSELTKIQESSNKKNNSENWLEDMEKKFVLMKDILDILKDGSRRARKEIIMEFGSNLTLNQG